MLNRSASLALSTSVLKALPGKLDIKRHSPSILYITSFILIKSAHLLSTYSKVHASPNKANLSTPVPEHPVDTSIHVAADYVNFDTDPDRVYVK